MLTNLPEIGASLNECSWGQISAVSRAGLASKYWSIGDIKTWEHNNVTYTAQIIGFDHDEVDESNFNSQLGNPEVLPYPRKTAGITFELCGGMGVKGNRSVLNTGLYAFNKGGTPITYSGYKTSTLANGVNTLMGLSYMVNSGLASVIVPVSKKCVDIEKPGAIRLGGDFFFLPSVSELVGIPNAPFDEGEQYEYYKKMGVKANTAARLVRYYGITTRGWWTRTLGRMGNKTIKGSAYAVSPQGAFKSMIITKQLSIAPLFCV